MPVYYEFIDTFPDHGASEIDLFFMKFAETFAKGISVIPSDFHLNDNPVSARYLNHSFTSDSISKDIMILL